MGGLGESMDFLTPPSKNCMGRPKVPMPEGVCRPETAGHELDRDPAGDDLAVAPEDAAAGGGAPHGGRPRRSVACVWHGQGVTPRRRTVGLRRWTVQLPTDADVAQLRECLERAGHEVEAVSGGFEVRDPCGTTLAVVSTAATDPRSHATVSTVP